MAKKRDYKQEAKLQDTPGHRAKQAARMRARRLMEKEGKVHPHDGKEVDHKKFLGGKGGKLDKTTEAKSNLRVISKEANRRKQPKRK